MNIILKKMLIAEYQKILIDCFNILEGIDTDTALYEKTICIINDISQKLDDIKRL